MFANDTNKTFAVCTLHDLQNGVNQRLISNKLSLNVAKTKFIITGSNNSSSTLSKLLKIRYFNIEVDAE